MASVLRCPSHDTCCCRYRNHWKPSRRGRWHFVLGDVPAIHGKHGERLCGVDRRAASEAYLHTQWCVIQVMSTPCAESNGE